MDEQLFEALVAIRNSQVRVAISALALDGYAVQPLVDLFGPYLVRDFSLGSRGGFDCLRVGTSASGPEALDGARDLLVRVYEAPPKVGTLALALGEAVGADFDLVVEEGRFALEPRSELMFRGPISTSDVFGILADAQVDPEVLEGFLGSAERLLASEVEALGLTLAHPRAAQPELVADFPWTHGPELLDTFQSSLDAVCAQLSVPSAQRDWLVGTAEAFAPRPVNHTPVSLAFGHEQVASRVTVTYPEIPAALLLKVLGQLAPDRDNGARLGALAGAVGLEEEVVSRLAVTVGTGADPELRFDLVAPGPPTVDAG